MEIRPPLPLPAVLSADERCSSAHLGKIPLTPILQKWLTWPFYILCTSFSNRRMDRKTLMKNINYSHSVLQCHCSSPSHALLQHICLLCKCSEIILNLRSCSFFGEDIENVISLLPCGVPNLPQHKVVDLQSSQEVVMAVLKCGFVQSLICSLFYFSTGAEIEQKSEGRNAARDWKCCLAEAGGWMRIALR